MPEKGETRKEKSAAPGTRVGKPPAMRQQAG
jgi:hypothetical protein